MPGVGEMVTTWSHSAGLHFSPFSPRHHFVLSSERGKSKKYLLIGGDLAGRRHRAAFPT